MTSNVIFPLIATCVQSTLGMRLLPMVRPCISLTTSHASTCSHPRFAMAGCMHPPIRAMPFAQVSPTDTRSAGVLLQLADCAVSARRGDYSDGETDDGVYSGAADGRAGQGLRVYRLAPGGPDRSARLAQLLVAAFYEEDSLWNGPISWLQRQVIEDNARADIAARLRYYEAARVLDRPNIGAVVVAEDSDGVIRGFLDIGMPEYTPTQGFVLPQGSTSQALPPQTVVSRSALSDARSRFGKGAAGRETEGSRASIRGTSADTADTSPQSFLPRSAVSGNGAGSGAGAFAGGRGGEFAELRPYVSNVAVDVTARRQGVGSMLMRECEEEVRRWRPAQETIWLEVSDTNTAARRFYEALGYEVAGRSTGREIVKKQFGYGLTQVKRVVMRKKLD